MSRPHHQCSRCRQRKLLVHHICGMGYCEQCKDKAPTREEFKAFRNEKLQNGGNWRDTGKPQDKFMRAVFRDR